MALFGDFGDDYTRTGKGFFTKLANGLSFIPGIGGIATMAVGMVDTVLEAGRWLFQGKFGSAATVLAAGTVGNFVNSMSNIAIAAPFWWGNVASGVTTSTTIGTHARAATEAVIGSISGALGSKPQVLSSYTAGIGSISASMQQAGPGKFASQVSGQRGQNADEAYARYMSGEGGVHVNELQSAYGRGA